MLIGNRKNKWNNIKNRIIATTIRNLIIKTILI